MRVNLKSKIFILKNYYYSRVFYLNQDKRIQQLLFKKFIKFKYNN
jgi:hypothetical protein